MSRTSRNRSCLLLGSATAAMALSLALPQRAEAQAINATGEVVFGSAEIVTTGPTEDTIDVSSPTVVINWTPIEDNNGTALDFLPTGTTAIFQSSQLPDFAVLNRILPSTNGDIAVIDGTVISRLFDPVGTATPGGTVAFYSPTGILVGPNATFDVGSLLLTTLDTSIEDFAGFSEFGAPLNLAATPGSTAQIRISPGAQVLATQENSFFAAVAANVQMFGTATVNGSHAYVAGEVVSLTFSNGLFDIQVPVGTAAGGSVMEIDGNVGGPSSTGAGDNHMIYAVARASTDPISMFFSGNLGFAPAQSAGVVNGEIILSANHDVFGRFVDGGSISDGITAEFGGFSGSADPRADILLDGFAASSSLLAIGTHLTEVRASLADSSVDGNLLVVGREQALLTSTGGRNFAISGDVRVSADAYGMFGSAMQSFGSIDAEAGQASLNVFSGSSMTIGGDLRVTAHAVAGVDEMTLVAGSALGGFADIRSTGGTLSVQGTAIASASAIGGGFSNILAGGPSFGGQAEILASEGGSILIGQDAFAFARAEGANGSTFDPSTFSETGGGSARIRVINGGGSITINGSALLDASAIGGTFNDAGPAFSVTAGEAIVVVDGPGLIGIAGDLTIDAVGIGGDNAGGIGATGRGGRASAATFAGGSIDIGGNFDADALGWGGNGQTGGDGLGGIAGANAVTGSISIGSNASARAEGFGGSAFFGIGGNGGNGWGGNSFFQADGTLTAPASVTIANDALLSSDGRGGDGGAGDGQAIAAGRGGDGIGGQFGVPNQADPDFGSGAYLLAGRDNGAISVGGSSLVYSRGFGGTGGSGGSGQAGGDGGAGVGGTAQAGQAGLGGDGSLGAGTASFNDITVSANGFGGNGGFGDFRGNGGAGSGFGAFFNLGAGNVSAGIIDLTAEGVGGEGEVGGDGTGGFAGSAFTLGAGLSALSYRASTTGTGGFGNAQGGAAIGGTTEVSLGAFDASFLGNVTLESAAFGGASEFLGGQATGGNVNLFTTDALSRLSVGGDLGMVAQANAFTSGSSGDAASATGGRVNLVMDGAGLIDVAGTLFLDAAAFGAENVGGGRGGDAFGGFANLAVNSGGEVLVGTDLLLSAFASGGNGTGGGDAFGGYASARSLVGLIDVGGNLQIDAAAFGGDALGFGAFGGNGGNALGGHAGMQARGTLSETGAFTVAGDARLFANGEGGNGGAGDGQAILAGRGGDGTGGNLNTPNQAEPNAFGGAYMLAGGDNGVITIGGVASADSFGFGGDGGAGGTGQAGGDGGIGRGGNVSVGLLLLGLDGSVGNGTFTVNDLFADASAFGGTGGAGDTIDGRGGDAFGDRAVVSVQGGSLTANTISVFATGQAGSGSTGGNGTGGSRAGFATNFGGEATFNEFVAFADGFGGAGFNGDGGTGTGGEAFMGFQGGTTTVNGDVITSASGFGGSSFAGGNGGDGVGGVSDIAVFSALAGTGTIVGNASVIAQGFGGDGADQFAGGNGTGGRAFVQSQAGGTVRIGSLQVSASGSGGLATAGTGGSGFGGLAELISIDSGSQLIIERNTSHQSFDGLNGDALLSADGIGRDTSGGTGIGGEGIGGTYNIVASGGGSIALPANPDTDPGSAGPIRLTASGIGGGSSVDGGRGGYASGGSGLIRADGGTITMGRTVFTVLGMGGSSQDDGLDIDGGDSAAGSGHEIVVSNGGVLTAQLRGTVESIGGNGSGSGQGGFGSDSLNRVEVDGGTLNAVGLLELFARFTGGSGDIGGDGGGEGGISFTANGGTINFLPDAAGNAGLLMDIVVQGGDGVVAGGAGRGAFASLSLTGSTMTGGSVEINGASFGGNASAVGGTGGAARAFGSRFSATDSTISLFGETRIQSTAVGGSGDGTGGDADSGTAALALFNSDLTITTDPSGAGDLKIESRAEAGAGAQFGLANSGAATIELGDSSLTANLVALRSFAESSSSAGAQQGGAASNDAVEIQVSGASTMDVGLFEMTSDALTGTGGTARAGDLRFFIDQGSTADLGIDELVMAANAFGGDPAQLANTAGQITLDLRGGRINTGNTFIAARGDTLASSVPPTSILAEGGSLIVSGFLDVDTLGDLLVRTGQGGIIGGPTVSDPSAQIFLRADGTIRFEGDNDNAIGFGGQSVVLVARDVDIAQGARIGAQFFDINSLETESTAILGGEAGEGAGFRLTAAELGRIEAGEFTFFGPSISSSDPNLPDILIRDATVFGSLDDGTSAVRIFTNSLDGLVRIEGTVRYVDAAATDRFSIFAQRIEVVTPGGIRIEGANGRPSGVIALNAADIWAADAETIAQLQADPNFTGRNELLSDPASGSDDPLGYLRAGTMELRIGNSLLVRNTGTALAGGGILVGDGGLSISGELFSELSMSVAQAPATQTGSSGGPIDVFAHGRRQRQDGSFVTGEAFFTEINFNRVSPGLTEYVDGSAFNDCPINTGECPERMIESPIEEEAPGLNNPTLIEPPATVAEPVPPSEAEEDNAFGMDFPGLVETPLISEDPLLDDPVASGGDVSRYSQGAGPAGGDE